MRDHDYILMLFTFLKFPCLFARVHPLPQQSGVLRVADAVTVTCVRHVSLVFLMFFSCFPPKYMVVSDLCKACFPHVSRMLPSCFPHVSLMFLSQTPKGLLLMAISD